MIGKRFLGVCLVFLSVEASAEELRALDWDGFYGGATFSPSSLQTEYASSFGVLQRQDYDADPRSLGVHAGWGRFVGPIYVGIEAGGQLFDDAVHQDLASQTSPSSLTGGSGGTSGGVVGSVGGSVGAPSGCVGGAVISGGGCGYGRLVSTTTRIEAFETELRAAATLRARAGFAFGRVMPFVTAGISAGNFKTEHLSLELVELRRDNDLLQTTAVGEVNTVRETAYGYTVGLGADVMVTPRLSLRGEYAFTDFESMEFGLSDNRGTVALDPRLHEVKLGFSVHF